MAVRPKGRQRETPVFVYRLNSSTQNDYYLVKANWETTPQPRINKTHPTRKDTCVKGDYCGYYNNLHDMAFSLSVVRGGVVIQGNVDNYMPKTVERNTTVTQKMGGSLSFGDKGVTASVSGEIATSYTYSAQNLIFVFGPWHRGVYFFPCDVGQ